MSDRQPPPKAPRTPAPGPGAGPGTTGRRDDVLDEVLEGGDAAPDLSFRAERSRETRERVLAIALEQVESGGEAAVRIDEIRERSGVSIGSIYHHFGDRDGVIAAAQLRRFARFAQAEIAALSDIVERSRDVAEFGRALRQFTADISSEVRTEERWGRIGALGSTIGRDDLRDEVVAIQTRLTDEFQAHVAQGQARGFFRADLEARAIAAFIAAYSLGFALNDLDRRAVSGAAWQQVVDVALEALLVRVEA